MSLTSSLSTLAAQEAAKGSLPMPAWVFGAIALAALVALLGFTWSFRNAGTKHGQHRGQGQGAAGAGHGGASAGGHH